MQNALNNPEVAHPEKETGGFSAEQPEDRLAENPADDATEYPEPRGAFFFVMLITLFFIAYFFITWVEVFVLRGGS